MKKLNREFTLRNSELKRLVELTNGKDSIKLTRLIKKLSDKNEFLQSARANKTYKGKYNTNYYYRQIEVNKAIIYIALIIIDKLNKQTKLIEVPKQPESPKQEPIKQTETPKKQTLKQEPKQKEWIVEKEVIEVEIEGQKLTLKNRFKKLCYNILKRVKSKWK